MWTQIAGEHADLLSPFRHHVSNSEYHEDFLKQAFFFFRHNIQTKTPKLLPFKLRNAILFVK